MTAYVERRPTDADVRLDYDPDVVDALKVVVPYAGRRWSPMTRTWIVQEPYVGIAIELLEHVAPPVHVHDLRPQPVPSAQRPDWARALHDQLDPADRDRVFRLLTSVLHPDRGAPAGLMTDLNRAFRSPDRRT